MSPTNKQSKNVGNLGDVLKHAALVRLARALAPRLHVETHSFLLEAPCPDPDRWLRETAAELARHAGYLDYFQLQHPILAGRPYRCSTGLVLDALAPATPSLVLAEANPETRADLRAQIEARGLSGAAIFDDAAAIDLDTVPPAEGPVLVHVDPFVLDESLWRSATRLLERLAASVPRVAMLVFTYEEGVDRFAWPAPPLATFDRDPYHLALYATPGAAPIATAAITDLGWTLASAAPGSSAP